jgi:SH3 domain protein
MRIKLKFLLCAVLLVMVNPPLLAAKTFYVTDKVLLGIYKEKSQESELIKVLPTATPLEILKREDNLARVRTPDGVEGWVDAAYLITEKPAQLTVLEITSKHRQAISDLDTAEKKVSELEAEVKRLQTGGGTTTSSGDDSAQLKKLTSANTALSKEKKDLQDKLAKLTGELDATRKAGEASKADIEKLKAAQGSQDDAALKAVQDEVTTLKTRISEQQAQSATLQEQNTALVARYDALQQRLNTAVGALTGKTTTGAGGQVTIIAAPADSGAVPLKWIGIGLLCVLILGLGLGAYFMDRRYLSRHGGFRI